MNKMKIGLLMVILGGSMGLFAQTPDFKTILATIDQRSNFKSSDFSAVVSLVSEDPEKGVESRTVRTFRRDTQDMFLMLILKPENQLGQGYLRVEDNLWFYDPESRITRLPPPPRGNWGVTTCGLWNWREFTMK